MPQKLVTVLTPCYNTASYIHRLLDSILSQTYPNIEMIIVNDGSTDNLMDVLENYQEKFDKRGIPLLILNQANSGQSVAIKNGLQYVKGDYLVWPDSDDFYGSKDAIDKMVQALENGGEEFAMVRTEENLLEDTTLSIKQVMKENTQRNSKGRAFEDCLWGDNGYYYAPGAYMAKFSKLKDATSLDIYTEKNAGQNLQLMLPLLYNYKCITIHEPLYNVIERTTSHSRGQYVGCEQILKKYSAYENTVTETLKRIKGMPEEEFHNLSYENHKHYCYIKIKTAFKYESKEAFKEIYSECKRCGYLTPTLRLEYLIIQIPHLATSLINIRSKVKSFFNK